MRKINLKSLIDVNFALIFNKLIPFTDFSVSFNIKLSKGKPLRFTENIAVYEKYLGIATDKIIDKYRLSRKKETEKQINKTLDYFFTNLNILLKLVDQLKGKDSGSREFIKNLIQDYKNNGFKIIRLKTGHRIVMGMGLPSFFENGLTFHHVYGVPYISSSSVKGLARFVYLLNLMGEFDLKKIKSLSEELEKRELKNFKFPNKSFEEMNEQEKKNLFVYIFGSQYFRGRVTFGDVFPEEFKYVVDITNPHFRDYYNKSERKKKKEDSIGEWQNPVPIPFLALENATFVFPYKIELGENKKFIENIVENILKEGLKFLGIGAKTRKGYGWFEEVES